MTWKKVRRLGSRLGFAAMVGLVAGCGGDSPTDPAPTTGSVRVTTATTGTDLDADGYMIAVDGGAAQAIGVNATVTVSNVTAAAHSVALSGLAANCSVSGSNPRSVTVTAGATAVLSFDVTCTSLTGNIEVAVNATGANIPGTFDVSIDGTPLGVVVTGSSATYGPYDLGDYAVELTLPANCTLSSGENPRTVTVPSGTTIQTVTTTYELSCGSTVGNIEVAVNATGANLPVLNNVTIDGTLQTATVVTGTSFTYSPYDVGDHTVEIEVAPNCTLSSGENPRTVTVPSGTTIQTVTTTYELSCGSTVGNIEVAVNATGANLPVLNNVTIDGTLQTATVVTGTSFTYSPYDVGDHTVEIEVAPNCTLSSGENPRTVTVPSGTTIQTVTTTYELSCVSTVGNIEVAVNATGANLPVLNNVTIDGTLQTATVVTGTSFTYSPYDVGDHTVEIEVAPNCTLSSGENPRTVTVPSGTTIQTVTTTYELSCVSTVGNIEVAVNATGANLPVLNNVTIDGTLQTATVVTGTSFTYSPYDVGDHTVEIEVAPNCTLSSGENPRTVTVPSGTTIQTVTTTYELSCVSTVGNIEVAVNATGANLPVLNNVTIDGTLQTATVVTGTSFTYSPYDVGDHTVEIEVAPNCTLSSGENPRTVTVPSGTTIQTVTTTYDLTCS